ncbi:MAG: MaoC family dehydratase [Acidobacteriota bacterium]|nr:MaoC family dehydratase [Acidobacteriota bacterium]
MIKVIPKEEMTSLAGREIGTSEWLTVDQKRIDQFAEATNDHQFIHVEPERAKATPAGGTIAHGFLTLSLLSHLTGGIGFLPEGHTMTYNYGLNKVRFLNPVKVNSRIRAHVTCMEVTEKQPGRFLMQLEVTIEIEGVEKPALVAESLTMMFTS